MIDNWIKERREALGLSQDALAVQLQAAGLDVTRATISHWETGRYGSPLDSARSIVVLARILKIPVGDLLKVAGYEVTISDYSDLARRAASIVEQLSPEVQLVAVEQLQVLQRHPANKPDGSP